MALIHELAEQWERECLSDDPLWCDCLQRLIAQLRAAIDAQRCETCRWHQILDGAEHYQICLQPSLCQVEPDHKHIVPLTINNRPFSCAGWEPQP